MWDMCNTKRIISINQNKWLNQWRPSIFNLFSNFKYIYSLFVSMLAEQFRYKMFLSSEISWSRCENETCILTLKIKQQFKKHFRLWLRAMWIVWTINERKDQRRNKGRIEKLGIALLLDWIAVGLKLNKWKVYQAEDGRNSK